MRKLVLFIFCLSLTQTLFTQASIQLTVLDGDATTTCSGPFGLPPQILWSVQVENEAETYYPQVFNCYTNPPNLQYTSPTYDCSGDVPTTLEVCFKAFENEAFPCNINENCTAEICEDVMMPIIPGSSVEYTLEIEDGQDSDGWVTIQLDVVGEYTASYNDEPCIAFDMGILDANSTLGAIDGSEFYNICANPDGISQIPGVGWFDNVGLWFSFTTGDEPVDLATIEAVSDPDDLGDPVNMQLIFYEAQNGDCSILQLIDYIDDGSGDDEILHVSCLKPNTTYMLLADGSALMTAGATGYFDIQITAESVNQAADFICDAEHLGDLVDGGSFSANLQTNNCATATNDATPTAFNLNQSVWYSFTAPPSGHVEIFANNHIPLLSNELIDLQLALFESNDNSCTGQLNEISSSHNLNSINELLDVQCLTPNTMYWILVDGFHTNTAATFDISVSDGGIYPPEVSVDTTICFGGSYTIGSNTYNQEGMYTDTLVAFNGCDSIVYTNLSIADSILVNTIEITPATLMDTPDGAAAANPENGQAPYTFQWSNGATTQSINNVLPAIYCVTVTDQNGCSNEDCIEVTFIGQINAMLAGMNLMCYGDTDGSISLNLNGGTPPYTYNWTNTSDNTQGSGTIANENELELISNLSAGDYLFTIVGSGGLSTNATTTLFQPDEISTILDETICYGEELLVGNSIYTQTGAINEILTAANGCDSIVNGMLTILPLNAIDNPISICNGDTYQIGNSIYDETGMYQDTLLDINGCDSLVTTILTELDPIMVQIGINQNASGYDLMDGNASLSAMGGNGNYTIEWSNGATTPIVSNLAGGSTVCVTVTDNLGCDGVDCLFIPYDNTNLASLTASELDCFGDTNGIIEITTGDGLAPYSYSWEHLSSGQTGTGTISSAGTVEEINLLAGNYTFTITDANSVSLILTTTISQAEEIQINIADSIEPTCFGDCDASFSIVVNGGTGNYTYTWSDSAINSFEADNLCSGDYYVTVSDANNCTATSMIMILEPLALQATAVETMPVNCFEGSDGVATVNANLNINTILWDNGETTPIATQLDAGVHTVTITDMNNCETTTTVEITQPLEAVDGSLTITETISCNGASDGSITLDPSGPGNTFTYEWNNIINGQATGSGYIITDLSSDNYSVTITNEVGCTAIQTIFLDEPEPISFDLNATDADCANGGTISVMNANGGTNPYVFSIDGENFITSTSFDNLSPGNYTLQLQDVEGCEQSNPITIAAPPEVVVELPNLLQITLGESIQLDPTVNSSNLVYTWTAVDSLACSDCPSIQVAPALTTTYQVEVFDTTTFCTDVAQVIVDVQVERDLYIPNAFSPNEDGINDFFTIYGNQGVQQILSLRIFDRWGTLVFERQNFPDAQELQGWDGRFRGKDLNSGVYVFAAEVEYLDGERLHYKGEVTLVR